MALGRYFLAAISPVVPSLEAIFVLGLVQILIGLDLALQCLAQQHGLTDHHVGFREVDGFGALLGDGHAAHDDVAFAGDQRGDDAVPGRAAQYQFDAQRLGHQRRQIGIEADDLAAFVGDFERHVGRFQTTFSSPRSLISLSTSARAGAPDRASSRPRPTPSATRNFSWNRDSFGYC